MQVPALGSPRDLIFRGYLNHEARVEIKKQKLMLLMTIGTPFIPDQENKNAWDNQAKKIYAEYVDALIGKVTPSQEEDLEDRSQKEKEEGLRRFYQEVIQKTSPKLSRDGSGLLHVAGLPKI